MQKYAFENLNRNKVCSIIKVDNLPSIKVAESLGMIKEDEFFAQCYNGKMLHYLYCIRKYLPREINLTSTGVSKTYIVTAGGPSPSDLGG